MHHLLPTSTSTDEQRRNADIAVLPIGSFEQHGTYLPLSTDTVIAVTISGELAAEYPVMQLPPITLSCSHEHSAWPGTTSISASTLFSVVNDVADSVTRSGLSALVLINAHGGNYGLISRPQPKSPRNPAGGLEVPDQCLHGIQVHQGIRQAPQAGQAGLREGGGAVAANGVQDAGAEGRAVRGCEEAVMGLVRGVS